MSLGQYRHHAGTNSNWGQVAESNNVAEEGTIQSVNSEMSRTELDSHANMPCMDREALVVSDTGKVMEVNPFMPNYDAIELRLVDAVLKYDCPYTDKTYTLLDAKKGRDKGE
eukprot:10033129-Ditylum_brightwellii.AAC.1